MKLVMPVKKPSNSSVLESIQKSLDVLLEEGHASIVEEKDGFIHKLSVTKRGEKAGKSVSIEKINRTIGSGIATGFLKRIYRRKGDLPNPSKSPKSEINRLTVRLSTRVSKSHEELFNLAAEKHDNKRAALERAIELLAIEDGLEL